MTGRMYEGICIDPKYGAYHGKLLKYCKCESLEPKLKKIKN